jgi:alpha-D-ribose 1-methylphosphonate 5-triphosphate synthase subunit PhnG
MIVSLTLPDGKLSIFARARDHIWTTKEKARLPAGFSYVLGRDGGQARLMALVP